MWQALRVGSACSCAVHPAVEALLCPLECANHCFDCMARSVKITALEVAVGDVVVVAAADDVEEGVGPPLALLQALWQTAKG